MKKLFLLILFCVISLQGGAGESSQKLEIIYFYSTHCKVCLELSDGFLPKIIGRYRDKIFVKKLCIDQPENLGLLLSAAERFTHKRGVTPSVLIGNDFIVGKKEIEGKLEFLIHKYSGTKFYSRLPLSSKDLIDTFKNISFLTILSAGLIDGINPCAFAVIVFFISFLNVYGYRKKEIVYIGTSYVLSVFITYILIGFGLFTVFYSMKHFYFLMKFFYYFVALFCFCLAGCALYDYLKYKKTHKTSELILQLPQFFKKRVHGLIGDGLRQKKNTRPIELCLVAFSVGFAVSLLEAACTGQVYLPTVMYIIKVPHLQFKAVFYLIFYNLMFILPLIAVFILSFLGVRSQQFNEFLKKNLGILKLVMAGFFFALGISILVIS